MQARENVVIKTNIENSADKKKACDTKCAELVDEGVTIESRVAHATTDNGEKTANAPSVKLTTGSLDINNGYVRCEATISDESTSVFIGDLNSPTLASESEIRAHVEYDTESKTQTSPVNVSCHNDDITSDEAKQSVRIEATDLYNIDQ